MAVTFWSSPDTVMIHQIMEQTGAQFEIVPCGDATSTTTQVLGGHIAVGYTKVAAIDKLGDEVRYLAVSMADNPIPHLTQNAPTVDQALGTKTIGVASYRCIAVPKSLKTEYPERYQKLRETFEQAKDDPGVIEKMKNAGIDPALMVDWTPEQLQEQTNLYWDAYDKYGEIFEAEAQK